MTATMANSQNSATVTPSLYFLEQLNPEKEEDRRVLLAISKLSQDPQFRTILQWEQRLYREMAMQCVECSGDALVRSQGAARILSDILTAKITALDVLQGKGR